MEILKKSWFNIVFLLVMAMVFTMACETLLPQEPEENELLDGPMEGLSYEEERQFLEGDITFNDEIFTVKKGLGPIFVGNSCVSCHAGDGKGHPFNKFIRFGQSDSAGGNPFATVGDKRNQLQHKAIPGYEPEKLPDGAPYSEFLAPAVTGLGFLDAVPDADIIAMLTQMPKERMISADVLIIILYPIMFRRDQTAFQKTGCTSTALARNQLLTISYIKPLMPLTRTWALFPFTILLIRTAGCRKIQR